MGKNPIGIWMPPVITRVIVSLQQLVNILCDMFIWATLFTSLSHAYTICCRPRESFDLICYMSATAYSTYVYASVLHTICLIPMLSELLAACGITAMIEVSAEVWNMLRTGLNTRNLYDTNCNWGNTCGEGVMVKNMRGVSLKRHRMISTWCKVQKVNDILMYCVCELLIITESLAAFIVGRHDHYSHPPFRVAHWLDRVGSTTSEQYFVGAVSSLLRPRDEEAMLCLARGMHPEASNCNKQCIIRQSAAATCGKYMDIHKCCIQKNYSPFSVR